MMARQKEGRFGGNSTRLRTTWYDTYLNITGRRALAYLSHTCEVGTIPANVGIVVRIFDRLRSHHMSVHRLHDTKRNTANIEWGED
jgi:hypothetical protein